MGIVRQQRKRVFLFGKEVVSGSDLGKCVGGQARKKETFRLHIGEFESNLNARTSSSETNTRPSYPPSRRQVYLDQLRTRYRGCPEEASQC